MNREHNQDMAERAVSRGYLTNERAQQILAELDRVGGQFVDCARHWQWLTDEQCRSLQSDFDQTIQLNLKGQIDELRRDAESSQQGSEALHPQDLLLTVRQPQNLGSGLGSGSGSGDHSALVAPAPSAERSGSDPSVVYPVRKKAQSKLVQSQMSAERYDTKGLKPGLNEVVDRPLNRTVCLKLGQAELVQEAQTLARLDFPAIPNIHDFGSYQGMVFYCRDRVPETAIDTALAKADVSESLDSLLAQGLRALIRVCAALQHAHSRGLTHGHLSAGCVRVGELGDVWVLGWGQAETGASKDSSKAAVQRDIKALGELLTEVLTSVYECSNLDLQAEGVPEALLAIVRASGGSGEGYQSVEDLQRDLENYLNGRRVSRDQEGPIRRLRRLARAQPAAALVLSVVLGVLLGLVTFGALEIALAQGRLKSYEARRQATKDELTDKKQRLVETERVMVEGRELGQVLDQIQRSYSPLLAILRRAREQRRLASTEGSERPHRELDARAIRDFERYESELLASVESRARKASQGVALIIPALTNEDVKARLEEQQAQLDRARQRLRADFHEARAQYYQRLAYMPWSTSQYQDSLKASQMEPENVHLALDCLLAWSRSPKPPVTLATLLKQRFGGLPGQLSMLQRAVILISPEYDSPESAEPEHLRQVAALCQGIEGLIEQRLIGGSVVYELLFRGYLKLRAHAKSQTELRKALDKVLVYARLVVETDPANAAMRLVLAQYWEQRFGYRPPWQQTSAWLVRDMALTMRFSHQVLRIEQMAEFLQRHHRMRVSLPVMQKALTRTARNPEKFRINDRFMARQADRLARASFAAGRGSNWNEILTALMDKTRPHSGNTWRVRLMRGQAINKKQLASSFARHLNAKKRKNSVSEQVVDWLRFILHPRLPRACLPVLRTVLFQYLRLQIRRRVKTPDLYWYGALLNWLDARCGQRQSLKREGLKGVRGSNVDIICTLAQAATTLTQEKIKSRRAQSFLNLLNAWSCLNSGDYPAEWLSPYCREAILEFLPEQSQARRDFKALKANAGLVQPKHWEDPEYCLPDLSPDLEKWRSRRSQ